MNALNALWRGDWLPAARRRRRERDEYWTWLGLYLAGRLPEEGNHAEGH